MFSLWRKARRENSAASRLLGSTSLRFALHGWQRMYRQLKIIWPLSSNADSHYPKAVVSVPCVLMRRVIKQRSSSTVIKKG
ncbi:hypothetical protein [Thiolapillus sp.]|uniref:hypothetical protein n=1 Tax=Thiolapillus sp. TaxID=2017437 RepID=UPI003AF773CC